MPEEPFEEAPERPRRVGARAGVVADEPVAAHQEWGAASSLPRERRGPPPGIAEGEPDLLDERGASASLAEERFEPAFREERQEWGEGPGGVRGPPPAAPRRARRPVRVTEENRPPGDPGPDVDVQEWVGGQPGRPDPGLTGGPTHAEVGARDQHGGERAEPIGIARYRDIAEERDKARQKARRKGR